jgi:hypothetical protein
LNGVQTASTAEFEDLLVLDQRQLFRKLWSQFRRLETAPMNSTRARAIEELRRMVLAALGERDAAVWKACQQLLDEQEGVEVASPNGAIRAARRLGWLSDADAQAGNPSSRDGNLGSRRARSAREHPPPGVGRGQRDGSGAAGG